MALWVVLASPLMIGADVRNMDDDSRSVWLNKGLIAAHQDPLGRQGTRVRGNATSPHVWRRDLQGGDLLVVVYNPDVSGTAPPPPPGPPATWLGPFTTIYSDTDCPNVGNHGSLSVSKCETVCESTAGCTAFNYGGGGCALRSCNAAHLGHPTWVDPGQTSYRMASVPAPRPPPKPVSVYVTWEEVAFDASDADVTELINDVHFGRVALGIVVNLTAGESAALRLSRTRKKNHVVEI